jgi:hypothetical protein
MKGAAPSQRRLREEEQQQLTSINTRENNPDDSDIAVQSIDSTTNRLDLDVKVGILPPPSKD